jgi:hypothetical protein
LPQQSEAFLPRRLVPKQDQDRDVVNHQIDLLEVNPNGGDPIAFIEPVLCTAKLDATLTTSRRPTECEMDPLASLEQSGITMTKHFDLRTLLQHLELHHFLGKIEAL